MTKAELKKKIRKHGEWLLDKKVGERLELIGAELRDSNLAGANLAGADFRVASFRGSNLAGADLSGADLSGADFRATNLAGADLSGADLSGACLVGANLCYAELNDANLTRANLSQAHLSGANLDGARLPHYQVCEGGLIGWKKVEGEILKVRIPEGAGRTASLVGRKCRAEYAEIISIADGRLSEVTGGAGLTYRVGETIHADRFDPDPREECAHGVHFFRTREEAEEYDI